MLFVCAMVTMALTGAHGRARDRRGSLGKVAGLLTFYFVTTALLTVRPPRRARSLDRSRRAMLIAVTVSALAFDTGFEIIAAVAEARGAFR